MKIGFITNLDKDFDLEFTKKLVSFLIEKEHTPILDIKFSNQYFTGKVHFCNEHELFLNSDFIIILGGDGTIISTSSRLSIYNKNILGINMGTLGYLADVEKYEALNAIEKVLDSQFFIEKRMMFKVFYDGIERNVLNEVNINNGRSAKMLKIAVDINNKFLEAFPADGLIVSTPTGSTAYNLSAGGPILKPDTELILLNYVCPHSLFARPYIVSGEDKVKVYITEDSSEAFLAFDGQEVIQIKKNLPIFIQKSEFYTNLIKTTNFSFYDVLKRKMVELRK